MVMLKEPWKKYKPFKPLRLPNRQWPDKVIEKAPRWLSSCLRDGNQSLPDPMNGEEKWRYFQMLCALGYKEIEVSFPSASQIDFDFTRRLIETPGAVPDDVFLQVLSPCRPDLIRRTVESVRGAKNAIIHIYLATSECFRQVVFGYTEEQTLELAVECTKLVRSLTKDNPEASGTNWQFEFSPECFSDTDPDYALKVCRAVKAAWGPNAAAGDQIIFNLPATVELATPNIYADLIEYFSTNIGDRESVCVSLHPHNDRGCSIAAAELGQMAGADRVEGCLFGNGERTGNVDLVTLALNLYTQGVSPQIDFSDLNSVIEVVESCTKIPVHQRAPYGGSLVCAAFSGSHQDAIKKGFQNRQNLGLSNEDPWMGMPYLPLDPQDIGRNYEAIIRVNSQSGKGGSAFILRAKLELDLPRGLQVAFSKIVQRRAEELGRELLANEITNLFETTYLIQENHRLSLIDYSISPDRSQSPMPNASGKTQDTKSLIRIFDGVILLDGQEIKLRGRGNGPISSMAAALKQVGIDLDVHDYKEHAIGEGRGVKAASYIECKPTGMKQTVWGVGIHEDVVQSSLLAMLSAASNFLTSRPTSPFLKPVATPASQETPSVISILEEKAANGI
ncbi:Isopropylmalate/homocitrate/citramalate synthase [Trichoderma simmonsii]|uniref:2-isopropylmalate synthase n=1 Tax=Trichoderma simmonsii TaxID=1491479 RepID=A0A8G0L911_9HYPO|nr:Isopropylmalate/homocitrate/citramalate synthase [Trichoderma simmonsii]